MLGNLGPGGSSFGSDPNVVPATDNNPKRRYHWKFNCFDDISTVRPDCSRRCGGGIVRSRVEYETDLDRHARQPRRRVPVPGGLRTPQSWPGRVPYSRFVSCDVLIPSSPYIFLAGGYPQSPTGPAPWRGCAARPLWMCSPSPILGTQSDSKTSRTVRGLSPSLRDRQRN